ncbi:MAG: efflux RND transporter periplasmic adaptor subunit [Candidatus Sumerlaeota bacterium]|nr:efflux RND transporter periplasmic adaptor subunit [Candidatus Sumerlaeota bacterium]
MKKRLIIAVFVLLAAGVGGWIYYTRFHASAHSGGLIVSGNIEVTDAQLSFKIPGRLLERLADEGKTVTTGQLIARLDKTDQELAFAKAQANLAYAQAVLAELEAGSRPEDIRKAQAQLQQAQFSLNELKSGSRAQEIADAEAEVGRAQAGEKTAQAQLDLAKNDEERYRELFRQGVIGNRDYEMYRTQYSTAKSAVEDAKARVVATKEQLSLRREGSRIEQIQRAQAALDQAEAEYALVKAGPRVETIAQSRAQAWASSESLRQARQQLRDTELYAPFGGVVMSKSAESGEYMNPGTPVVTIADLDHVWLRAYIGERDLGKIRLGMELDVTTDAYPGSIFIGRVSFISDQPEFTPKSVQTFEERVKLVYRIKIDLDNRGWRLKPGLPADAHIPN